MDWLTAALAAAVVILVGINLMLARKARQNSARLRSARDRAKERAGELEERLRAAEAALHSAENAAVEREPLAVIGELSAMVAHEIRNPLTIIGNAVTTLRRKETSEEDRATLHKILEEEAARLNEFMNDLLRYGRPLSLQLVQVDVREVVERALSLVQDRPELDVELIEPQPVGKVLGDNNLLRQVFENLVNNAAQAMGREGGMLTVRLLSRDEGQEPGVVVSVEDTGEGMDTSVRDRALLPFFTTRSSGTGLGLAIVAKFVEAHGGKVEIKSAAGRGTAMQVFLPRQQAKSNDVGKSHPRMKGLASATKAAGRG